jgi:hypothetical protein
MSTNPIGTINVGGQDVGPAWGIDGTGTNGLSRSAGSYQTDLNRVTENPAQLQEIGRLAQSTARLGQMTAPQIQADKVQAASNQSSEFNQSMAAQNSLAREGMSSIGGLNSAARGAVPSAAELQGRMQLQQALANTSAMGASARGSADSRAAAQRQAMQQNSALSGNVIAGAAANRASEQSQARQTLVGAIQGQQAAAGQQTNAYASMAQQQAGLEQQAALANQQAGLSAQGANQSAVFQNTQQKLAANIASAGLYQGQLSAQNQLVDYNNQQSQTDFNRQMAMNSQANQLYGIQQQVAVASYQADQARAAQEQQGQYQLYGSLAQTAGGLINAYLR